MRAVQATGQDGLATVFCQEVGEPEAGAGDVVIDVESAGVVFPDLLHTRGLYHERYDPPFTLGGECAGVVRSAPAAASIRPGDRVAAVMKVGAFAEVVAVPAGFVLPLPDNLSMDEGACLPL